MGLVPFSLWAFELTGTIGTLIARPRVIVDLERFLRRPLRLGHVAQVEPDPRPCCIPAPHRVHHDVGGCEMGPNLGMASPPALEAGARLSLGRRTGDLDQRGGGSPPAGGPHRFAGSRRWDLSFRGRRAILAPASRELDPSRLALLLDEMWRPRCVAEAGRLVLRGKLKQWFE